MPRAERDLDGLTLQLGRRRVGLDRFLDETYTDGLLVLHRGKRRDRAIHERHDTGLAASADVGVESVTSAVCGVLVGRGLLAPADPLTAHIPELAGTSWEGCTVRHLLDMRAGTRFNEDYDDLAADVRVYEQIYQWRPKTRRHLPDDITAYFPTLRSKTKHGGAVRLPIGADRCAGVGDRARCGSAAASILLLRELWQPMGAEFDAEITVDRRGNAMADGGVSCTLRDLARFGQLLADGGRRVVPRAWIRDTLTPDADTVEVFASTADARELAAGSFYRNQFWVVDPAAPIYMGSGDQRAERVCARPVQGRDRA